MFSHITSTEIHGNILSVAATLIHVCHQFRNKSKACIDITQFFSLWYQLSHYGASVSHYGASISHYGARVSHYGASVRLITIVNPDMTQTRYTYLLCISTHVDFQQLTHIDQLQYLLYHKTIILPLGTQCEIIQQNAPNWIWTMKSCNNMLQLDLDYDS